MWNKPRNNLILGLVIVLIVIFGIVLTIFLQSGTYFQGAKPVQKIEQNQPQPQQEYVSRKAPFRARISANKDELNRDNTYILILLKKDGNTLDVKSRDTGETYTVNVADTTIIVRYRPQEDMGKEITAVEAKVEKVSISELFEGAQLTVFSSSEPYEDVLTARRIEFLDSRKLSK